MRERLSFLLSFLIPCCALAADAGAPDSPAAELAAFKLRDGYEAKLFASEADGVSKPIQMRFDSRGRLWVACSTIYPQLQPEQSPNDKIIVLEDRDGDGRADKSVVFAEGLLIPTGLEPGDGGLYVGTATRLLHLVDLNGDLRADQERVVLRGFGTGDSHQNINSFCWSPGGQLFMSQGLHAFSDVETPHGIVRLHQAGILRLTPHELRLEPFFGEGMTPHNPWGFVWDDWMTPFMVAGNGDGIYYLSPCLVGTSHRHEFQRIFRQGNKYCGVDLVGSRHLPDDLQGKLIAGGFMNNRIVVFRLEDEGSGFSAKEEPPLLLSSDVSFRPVDVKVGPDGAIYVADWYNPIIGHYQASFRDPRRDKAHGRIWRITARGRTPVRRPALDQAGPAELLQHLKSDERWVRYQARRELSVRKPEQVEAAVRSWIAALDPADRLQERYLAEGLAVYEMLDRPELQLLERVLEARDFRARAYATEVVGRWHSRLDNPLKLLASRASDQHPRVRLQAVVAASRIPNPKSIEVALSAIDYGIDRFLNDALVQTVFALKEYWKPAFAEGKLSFDNKANRLEFLLKTDASPDTLRATVDRLKDPGLSGSGREALLAVMANVGTPAELATVLNPATYTDAAGKYDTALHARSLPHLTSAFKVRKIKPAGNLEEAIRRIAASNDVALLSEALKLAGAWRLDGIRPEIETAAIAGGSEALRAGAIEALANFKIAGPVLHKIAADDSSLRLRAAAIRSELMIDESTAAQDAASFLRQSASDAAADEVFAAFLSRSSAVAKLASALNTNKPSADAAKIGLRRMSASGRSDEKLAQVLIDAAGLQREKRQLSPEAIASFGAEARSKGNAREGEAIYNRAELNCAACHTIGGKGGATGPDLSALGTAQPVEFIIGAILFPNREVKEGYTAIEVTMKSGDSHQGYVVRENAQELVLKDVAINGEVRVAKSDIASRQQRGSVMPEGLVDTLTQTEFRDLVRYLSDLGRQAK